MRKSMSMPMPISRADGIDHPITIKMMRLNRPEILKPVILSADSTDLPVYFNDMLNKDIATISTLPTINISQFLTMNPDSMYAHLGETFSLYVTAHNEGRLHVKEVSINMYVQSTTSKFQLPSFPIVNELGSEESFDNILHYEVKELGSHILICEVTYVINEVRSMFRKYYKLEVLKPFDLVTKFYNEDEHVLLETQIQNITDEPFFLERVSLEPSEVFRVESLNESVSQNKAFSKPYLLPNDVYQFLFRLSPKFEVSSIKSTSIGKLDIVWCSKFGEKGKIQSVGLNRQEPTSTEISVSLRNVPDFGIVSEPFDFICTFHNTTVDTKEYNLYLEESDALVWGSINVQKLLLAPNESKQITLSTVSLNTGLQYIPNIVLEEVSTQKMQKFSNLCPVRVFQAHMLRVQSIVNSLRRNELSDRSVIRKSVRTIATSGYNQFEDICNETLESLCDYIDALVAKDDRNFDVAFSNGVLTADFGSIIGTYIINRQLPNRQIWLSSPYSGPFRYNLMKVQTPPNECTYCWVYRHDGNTLHNLLQSEFRSIFPNQKVDFSKCAHSVWPPKVDNGDQ